MKLPSENDSQIAEEAGGLPTKTPLYKPDINAPIEAAGGLSRKEIEAMKKAEIKKPEWITWGDWLGPRKLSTRALSICYLAAMGWKNKDIAQHSRMSEGRIYILLQSEICQVQVQLIREVEFQGLGTNQQIDQLAPQAARVAQEILMSSTASPKVKWQVARDVLDRKLGKPKQTVEHTGSVINDLYEIMMEREQERNAPKALPENEQDKALEIECAEYDEEDRRRNPEVVEAEIIEDPIRSKLAKAGF